MPAVAADPARVGTVSRTEIQAERALRIALIGRRRPVVAALARAVRGSNVVPAGSGKEDTVAVPLGGKEHTSYTILSGPLIFAVADQLVALGLGGQAPAAATIGAGGVIGRVSANVAHAAFPHLAIELVILALGTCLAPSVVIAVTRGTGCAHIAGRPLDTQTHIDIFVPGVRTGGRKCGFWMPAIIGTGIVLSATDLTTGAASGMMTAVRTILPKFAAGVALGMIALVGAILFQFAADAALGVLAAVGTGIVLGATDPTAGLTRRMITAIRAIGFLLQTLPAHRLLRAQAQRRQKQ